MHTEEDGRGAKILTLEPENLNLNPCFNIISHVFLGFRFFFSKMEMAVLGPLWAAVRGTGVGYRPGTHGAACREALVRSALVRLER